MAQVAHPTELQSDIDYYVDYQFRAWRSIPEYAEWWADMDGIEREVFHLEWTGITEYRLSELQRWAKQGILTPAQRVRYDDLMKLVAQYRSVVDAMLRC